jgi:hypothetical protein
MRRPWMRLWRLRRWLGRMLRILGRMPLVLSDIICLA